MKVHYLFIGFVVLFACLVTVNPAISSDYGCQVLLCLSNPGGATQFEECEPPIRRLYEDLYNWKPFPKCDFNNGGEGEEDTDIGAHGMSMQQGIQLFLTCEESYGSEYEPYNPPPEKDNNGIAININHVPIVSLAKPYPDGFPYIQTTVCRKQIGTRMTRVCTDVMSFWCPETEVPVYDTKPVEYNSKPHFVQVSNGDTVGERFYYKKKKRD